MTKKFRGKKKVCPFHLLENSRPLFPSKAPDPFLSLGTLDFLSAYLGIASLSKETVEVKWGHTDPMGLLSFLEETPALAPLLHVYLEERMCEDKAGGKKMEKLSLDQ